MVKTIFAYYLDMKKAAILFVMLLLVNFKNEAATEIYSTNEGTVTFRSEAVQELISATSNTLRGLIDSDQRTFAFKILIRSFYGFNNGLQREHFNENYMESDLFPEAIFKGKIIEQIDLTKDGKYTVRAKGVLSIHGVEQERIIKGNLTVQKGIIQVETTFSILITDHNIKVPRVVHEKIASEIEVKVTAIFKKVEE